MKEYPKYTLSLKAKQDIKDIARFTIFKFGANQSKKYAKDLKQVLKDLCFNPEIGKRFIKMNESYLLKYPFKAHIIFYYPNDKGIYIVRILNGKMDIPKHIE